MLRIFNPRKLCCLSSLVLLTFLLRFLVPLLGLVKLVKQQQQQIQHTNCFPLQRSHLLFFLFLLSLRKTMYSMDQPEKLVHLKEEAAKFSKEVSKRLRSGHPNSNEGPKLPRSQDIDTWWCSPTSRTNLLSHTLCSLSLTLSLTHRRSFQRVLHIRQVFFPFSILTFLIISVSIFSSQ